MLSEQLTPAAAFQKHCNSTNAENGLLKDENFLITYDETTISMTKQLAAPSNSTTISNANLAPNAVITVSPTTTATSSTTSSLAASAASIAASASNAASTATSPAALRQAGSSNSLAPPGKPNATPTSSASNDASGRSAALERAYVHDVYENCEEPTGPIRPRVAQFLSNLDAGSVVCDVGCGSGRYLTQCNPAICTVGVDRCYRLSKVAKEKGGEVAVCDNLELPFRDECFDAVLSLAVVHHFATTERRVSALRELARILRIGGRVVITVWALEQRHRRFESQDVLIPWQPPKNRDFNYSDEEDDDDFLPPYHAYTEDSTNSSRSAGDGDSSSLSSSSPGESCYSFVRRAIQKLAGGRKHPWFLDSWTSKDTKNDSSIDYEDAKDLPIELRRLEDFEDFPDPPLSAGLKSRSLGSILNPPPRQIVRSRSSVPSLGGPLLYTDHAIHKPTPNAQFLTTHDGQLNPINGTSAAGHSPTNLAASTANGLTTASRRPKLIKQKQSLCDEDYQLPENPFHMISSYNSSNNSVNSSLYMKSGCYHGTQGNQGAPPLSSRQLAQASLFLRKQSSLNEELMAGNRIREKERVRKRIQKQMSLNEAFLCRSALFSKRLQVIREGFTSKIKSSTGSLERVTKSGLNKIIQNLKPAQTSSAAPASTAAGSYCGGAASAQQQQSCGCPHHQHHHHHHQHQQTLFQSHLPPIIQKNITSPVVNKFAGPVTYCNSADCASTACYCSTYHHGCNSCSSTSNPGATDGEPKTRRHSRESGSDSSKDSSLQSDTSIESEDSFASVIFIPKPEQHQQQLNYQQQHQNSNSSSSNSSSSNGGCQAHNTCCLQKGGGANPALHCKATSCNHINGQHQPHQTHHHHHRIPSVPTSPLIMPCPPTPAHSPAAAQGTVTSPPQTMAAVTAAMAILTPPCNLHAASEKGTKTSTSKNRFNFDEAHIKRHEDESQAQAQDQQKPNTQPAATTAQPQTENQRTKSPLPVNKITRQTIKDLPPIPKFRKQQSLQLQRQSFPIVRRSSATSGALPSMPKLLSLELFNPATDDLDSDSSEPSSPDSIDSVISAPKSALPRSNSNDDEQTTEVVEEKSIEEQNDFIKVKQQQYHNGDLKINPAAPNDIILNDDSSNILPHGPKGVTATGKQQDCAEFAEKLSAQLLREIEDKTNRAECRSLDGIGDIGEYLDDMQGAGSGGKKRNGGGEVRDLNALREELRERRLMLANLSTQPSLQQSPTSSSTSSLSSQTRSFTIHEEDEEEDEEENERSYTLQLYENCKISKFNYKRNRHYNLNPETAYLLQDDGDSSVRDEDEMDDVEHDVILEEDEDEVAAADADTELVKTQGQNPFKYEDHKTSLTAKQCQQEKSAKDKSALQNRHSTESWEHSNSSTTSLDSPSQGGATTHHRYYHVFREGELDALINHHVASLHIVSSYYERASWCVVAEKVQVWTI